jgi:hypothetical protein
MFPMNPGGTLKSIRAKIAFPASSAVTTAAGCVLVCVNAAVTIRLNQKRKIRVFQRAQALAIVE